MGLFQIDLERYLLLVTGVLTRTELCYGTDHL